ncbi:hypothetical protein DFH11DRAFT_1876400 [Phellopilus nigrolimitatus]|nr:hypothetical protein DFH11DRAFT_1876400 [Phellopilus nigrolimitatus]
MKKHARRQRLQSDSDANVGSDFDAMRDMGEGEADDTAAGEDDALADAFSIPNGVFHAARILVNPRLFGPDKDEQDGPGSRGKYVLGDWDGAPRASSAKNSGIPEARRHPKRRDDRASQCTPSYIIRTAVQITAEKIPREKIPREAQERQETVIRAPKQRVDDFEELNERRGCKRKVFEERIRRTRGNLNGRWYMHFHLGELLGNVPGAHQEFERWVQWELEDKA